MSGFTFTLEPPIQWDSHCNSNRTLFHCTAWQNLLKNAFGSQSMYGWHPTAGTGLAITVFKAGPFRIGYTGFPIGGTASGEALTPEMIVDLRKTQLPLRLHCLRLPVSSFSNGPHLDLAAQENPETAILGLQEWGIEKLPKLRRDIKKARSSHLQISDAVSPDQGDTLHRLYHDTVRRHRGELRYNASYFSSLINLAQTHRGVRCLLAKLDEEVAGFIVIAFHGRTAYYLHGAASPTLRHLSPSDLLLHEAINWAKSNEMTCFNMMPSPNDQPTLVRYKEKWNGTTAFHRTHELDLAPFYARTFRAAAFVYRLLRHKFML